MFICLTRRRRSCGGDRGAGRDGGAGWGENEDIRWGGAWDMSSVSRLNGSNVSWLPVNPPQGTAGQEVTAYEAMSSLVNYIQPNKFISFDNARSMPLPHKFNSETRQNLFYNGFKENQSYTILDSVSLLHREKQELRHLIFCGDQRGGNDLQVCCWICRVSFKSAADC